jgi:hypothetical protein
MTTPRDLLMITMDMPSGRPVERGDLSLALAGAEMIDLLQAGAVGLERRRAVPGPQPATGDGRLDEAAAALVREEPYESVDDWLWRRGRGLSAAYLEALEADGEVARIRRRRWGLFRTDRIVLVDSSARDRAAHRWAADEPVLATLATAVGVQDRRSGAVPGVADDAAQTVLDAVADALAELADERQRRARRLQDAAQDNVRRGY